MKQDKVSSPEDNRWRAIDSFQQKKFNSCQVQPYDNYANNEQKGEQSNPGAASCSQVIRHVSFAATYQMLDLCRLNMRRIPLLRLLTYTCKKIDATSDQQWCLAQSLNKTDNSARPNKDQRYNFWNIQIPVLFGPMNHKISSAFQRWSGGQSI